MGVLLWFEFLLQTLKLQKRCEMLLGYFISQEVHPFVHYLQQVSNKLSKSLVPLPGLKVLHKVTRRPAPQGLESLFSEHQSAVVGDVASQCSAKGPVSKLSEENKATEKWHSLFHPDSVSVLQHVQSQAQGRRGIRIFKERGKTFFFFFLNVLIFPITNVQSLPHRAGLSSRLRSSVRKIMGKNLFLEAFGWKTVYGCDDFPDALQTQTWSILCTAVAFTPETIFKWFLSFQWCIVTKKKRMNHQIAFQYQRNLQEWKYITI